MLISRHFWYAGIAGMCAIFIGLGLCRFSYTALVPELIHQGWVSKSGAAYLGTINFLGYLLGALFAKHTSKWIDTSNFIKINLVLSVLSLALCAFNWGFVWLSIWRFFAGMTGAFLMVITPSIILKNIPVDYRGRISGVMFSGMGLGVVISGLLFPALAKMTLSFAWLGAAFFALIALLVAWPVFSRRVSGVNIASTNSSSLVQHRRTLILISIAYALFGIGIVPHTLFLVDYVHTELGLTSAVSGLFWSIYGIGALMGPFMVGFVGDRIGIYKTLVSAFLLSAIAVALVLYNQITMFYVLSAFLMGALVPAIVALTSSRMLELVGVGHHPSFWGKMTVYFSATQMLGSYVMSYLLHQGASYTICFVIADIVFVLGFIAVLLSKQKVL